MSFRILLYLAVLLPFVVLSAVTGFSLQHLIRQYEGTVESDRQTWGQAATRRIGARMDRMDKVTVSLSKPTEIVGAVVASDNEVLFGWGVAFVGEIDTVFFTDTSGMVLARAPDEFRFGDSVESERFFRDTLKHGTYLGVGFIDGTESIVACRTIRKYDDIIAGTVCVAEHVTPTFLANLSPGETMYLSFIAPDGTIAVGRNDGDLLWRMPLGLSIDGYDFELAFPEDQNYADLLSLERKVFVNGFLAAIVVLIALLVFIRIRFAPYSRLVNSIVDYSTNKLDLDTLRKRLTRLRSRPTSEITRISTALIGMIDVIKENLFRIEEFNAYLRDLASKDPLTQLRNRRALDEALAVESQRARRYGSPLCVLVLDADHFKAINDIHGHATGDEVLRNLSAIIAENSRSTDIVGRWGGEEFLVLCPGIRLSAAHTYAEKLRQRIERMEFVNGLHVTVSIGLAEYTPNEPIRELVERADKALYKAKADGRNKVEFLTE